ncbi:lytic transglycosylase domain-containing protein [Methylicorpusculum oleiharenae]|uniref:lytic transglycosylase domain-containing protein n=1 Tax=Methylicorpusculum oleiharenae TaxID=1338687 RepID=UPI001E3E4310|nr:lytic transglycosylase domain-containing protein [Methylicorpusculum oleiharenae]
MKSQSRTVKTQAFMIKPKALTKQVPVPLKPARKTSQGPRIAKKKPSKVNKKPRTSSLGQKFLLLTLECAGLSGLGLVLIIFVLGWSAQRFTGTGFLTHMLPFAIGVLLIVVIGGLLLAGWWRLRKWLNLRAPVAIFLVSTSCLALVYWSVVQAGFIDAYGHFRTLVGGKEEVRRITIGHQVYAAYRRMGHAQLIKLVERGGSFDSDINEAARRFDVDADLLKGVAAAESSFLPRTSADGGHGLFQITRVPESVKSAAKSELKGAHLDLENHKHNAFLAAATLKHYLNDMHGDLFLGLLAYNIGPQNGGLRFIMKQYGVTDFATIQPYLQILPRDYPIRVLTYALAFRIWKKEGKLLAYEEGDNAVKIQKIGIPGF